LKKINNLRFGSISQGPVESLHIQPHEGYDPGYEAGYDKTTYVECSADQGRGAQGSSLQAAR
jgi:hypothetical protein